MSREAKMPKFGAAPRVSPRIGDWPLGFPWTLDIGPWSFVPAHSPSPLIHKCISPSSPRAPYTISKNPDDHFAIAFRGANCPCRQRQGRFILQPRVGPRHESLPWVFPTNSANPERVLSVGKRAAMAHRMAEPLQGSWPSARVSQGRCSCLAPTLGWRMERRWR